MLFILFTSHLLLWFCSHDAAIDVFPLRIWKCALPRNLCDYVACCFVSQYSPPRNYLGKLSWVRNIADSTAEIGVFTTEMLSYLQRTRRAFQTSDLVGMQTSFKSRPSLFCLGVTSYAVQKWHPKEVLKLTVAWYIRFKGPAIGSKVILQYALKILLKMNK